MTRRLLAGAVAGAAAATIAAVVLAREPAPAAAAVPRVPLAILLAQLVVIVTAARVLAVVARKCRQPAVIGELASGLLLGPSLLGAISPDAFAFLFPASSLATLGIVGQIGIVLYMFLVGLNLQTATLARNARAAVLISHTSIVVPMLVGAAIGWSIFDSQAPPGVSRWVFCSFIGIAMSITAFPVLARILHERGLSRTPFGTTVLTCAAVDDVTAWLLLAFIVAGVTAGNPVALAWTVALLAAQLALLVYAVRPALNRMRGLTGRSIDGETTAMLLVIAFISAGLTELWGVHAAFGAFAAGTVMPSEAEVRDQLRQRLETVAVLVLLPVYLAFTGLRTRVSLLAEPSAWALCVLIIVAAVGCKLVAAMLAARATGIAMVRCVLARRADEHPRPDGAGRAEHRLRPRHAVANHVHHVRADGAGHHRDGFSAPGPR